MAFTQGELDAYEKAMHEIEQARAYGEMKEAAGFARGKSSAILAVLAAHGIAVSDQTRIHIEACRDAATLDRWIARAVTAASAEEVIAAPGERR